MENYYRDAFEGLRDAAQHLMAASTEIHHAGAALVTVADRVLHAKNEHEDLKETVARLEALVMEQSTAIRALREDVAALRRELGQ